MLHIVGILFPHIDDDARSRPHQICHLVCELQLSHMEANAAVLLYVALMTEMGPFWCAKRARDFLENVSLQAAITSSIFSQDKPSVCLSTV